MIMRVLILAAGYATRLYPLTKNIPKPLIEVGNKPIIDHILAKMERMPVKHIYVVTNNRFNTHFNEWKNKSTYSWPITIVNDGTMTNDDRLGAIGDIYFAIQDQQVSDDLLVIAGDNLFEFSLKEMHEEFRNKGSSVIALKDFQDPTLIAKKYGVVRMDTTGLITDFEEKPEQPKSTLASTACYFFTREDLQLLKNCIQDGVRMDNTGDFVKYLVQTSEVYGFPFTEQWFDIGSPEQLQEAKEFYSKPIIETQKIPVSSI